MPDDHVLRLAIRADPMAVREGLAALCSTMLLRDLTPDARGTAEIVLAEALNNVVEHAISPLTGEIEITIEKTRDGLVCRIVDGGRPMPGEELPAGGLPGLDDDLPEGGFGWHLIRNLSHDLHYARSNGQNYLSFRLGTQPEVKQ